MARGIKTDQDVKEKIQQLYSEVPDITAVKIEKILKSDERYSGRVPSDRTIRDLKKELPDTYDSSLDAPWDIGSMMKTEDFKHLDWQNHVSNILAVKDFIVNENVFATVRNEEPIYPKLSLRVAKWLLLLNDYFTNVHWQYKDLNEEHGDEDLKDSKYGYSSEYSSEQFLIKVPDNWLPMEDVLKIATYYANRERWCDFNKEPFVTDDLDAFISIRPWEGNQELPQEIKYLEELEDRNLFYKVAANTGQIRKVKWETIIDDKARNKTDASKEWIVRDWAGIHKGKYPDIANYD
tara:strand:+ start:2149 stop:3027 length:879 start_codon:yes stop_codon:yes gene_type:complete